MKKKGFTLVEVIVSFVLIMVVMIYLLRTIISVSNKNNELITMQEYVTYESSLLNSIYKDVDEIFKADEYTGVDYDTANKVRFLDIDKLLEIDVANNSIIYDGTIYKLPSRVTLRKENNKYYHVIEGTEGHDYCIIKIHTKVYDIDDDISIIYQNKNAHSIEITFHGNGGAPTTQTISRKHSQKIEALPEVARTGYDFTRWTTNQNNTGDIVTKPSDIPNAATDLDYYAQWQPKKFIVTFNINGGSAWTSSTCSSAVGGTFDSSTKACTKEVTYDSTYGVLPTPTRTGYDFTEWNTKADGSGSAMVSSNDVKITSNKTVYAQWKGFTYYVKFDKNADSATGTMSNEKMEYDVSKKLTKNAFTRTGYGFVGWNEKADGSKTAYLDEASVKNLTNVKNGIFSIYAQWIANTYTVSYVLDGGSYGTSHPTSGTYDTAFTVNNPTKTGYTFAGWNITGMDSVTHTYGSSTTTNTSISGTKATSFKNLRSTSGTVTFTATWEANTYAISYDLDGGSHGTSHPTSGTYDTAFTVNNPTKTGYAFTGWNITGMDSVTHTYGSSTTTNTSISETKATSFKNLRSTSGTVTFTATWEEKTATLAYNGNSCGTAPSSVTMKYTTATNAASAITKEGYKFTKWCTKSDGSGTCYNASAQVKAANVNPSAITLFAICSAKKLTVTFHKNDGTTTTKDVTYTYGASSQAFTNNSWSRTGYSMSGWNEKSDGSGQGYQVTNTVGNSWIDTKVGDKATNTLNLYATWKAETVTVVFHRNHSSSDTNTATETYTYDVSGQKFGYGNGHSYAATTSGFGGWTRTGYNYNGWGTATSSTSATYTGNNDVGNNWIHSNAGKTVNLYAVWSEKTATLAYNGNSCGTAPSSVTMKYTTATNASAAISKTGYNFSKWCTASNGGGTCYNASAQVKAANVVPSATTLFAICTEKTATLSYDANGHGTAPSSVTMKYTAATKAASAITATGYTFSKWCTNKNGSGTCYNAGAQVKAANVVPSATKLYAIWTTNKYYVDVNGYLDGSNNGGTSGFGTFDVYKNGSLYKNDVNDFYEQLEYGTKYEIKDIKATTGHTYGGVKEGKLSGTIGTSAVGIRLTFTTNKVTVVFNYNKPDNTGTVSQTFTYGVANNKFGYKTDGSNQLQWGNSGQFGVWDYSGRTLLGWNTNKNATSATWSPYCGVQDSWINSNQGKTITVYAIWASWVKVRFYKNTPDDSGYVEQTFTKWRANNKFGYKTDGSNQPQWSQTGQFGQWDYSGYTLEGWGTSAGATSKTYNTYSGVDNGWIESNAGKTVTLYGVWTKTDRNSVCGCETWNTKQVQGTCKTYKRCKSAGCSTWTGYVDVSCYGQSSTACPNVRDNYNSGRGSADPLYRCVKRTGCGDAKGYTGYLQVTSCSTYNRGAGCGCEEYNYTTEYTTCKTYYSCKHTAGSAHASIKCISNCH